LKRKNSREKKIAELTIKERKGKNPRREMFGDTVSMTGEGRKEKGGEFEGEGKKPASRKLDH